MLLFAINQSNLGEQPGAGSSQATPCVSATPLAVRAVFKLVAAAQPALMQAGSEQLTPTQLAALQQIFGQQ